MCRSSFALLCFVCAGFGGCKAIRTISNGTHWTLHASVDFVSESGASHLEPYPHTVSFDSSKKSQSDRSRASQSKALLTLFLAFSKPVRIIQQRVTGHCCVAVRHRDAPACMITLEVTSDIHECVHCGQQYSSRNKLFAHLKANADTCGAGKALKRPEKAGQLCKSILSVGYGAAGGAAAEMVLREKLEPMSGLIKAINRASDFKHRNSLLFNQQLPSVHDLITYSTEGATDDTKDIDEGNDKEAWLRKLNADLSVHGVEVFDRQYLKGACHQLMPERDCTSRTYECIVPLEYLVKDLSTVEEVSIWKQLKQIMRTLTSPKTAKQGSRKTGIQAEWLATHAWHNFANAPAVPTDAAVQTIVDRFWVSGVGATPLRRLCGRNFVSFCVAGDGVVDGQVERMVGTALCILHGWLPLSFAEFALDLWHIIDTPSMPEGLTFLRECSLGWYQKRVEDMHILHANGRPAAVQAAMDRFEESIADAIASSEAASTDVAAEWLYRMEHEICPQIKHRMLQIQASNAVTSEAALSSKFAGTNTSSCPPEYDEVLHLLRKVDAADKWPRTSVARAKLMSADESGGSISLVSPALARTISEKHGESHLPLGNLLFPELVQAVFALEQRLAPGRPSSTWTAINRRASFRPHTDAGKGLGQSKSLIVGIGDYTGGELAVEGAVVQIRYAPHEFDGWRSRHWTLPFQGERFSIVWFSPEVDESVGGGMQRYAYD